MATLNFNAANVVPDTGRGDPVPAGWYIVTVTGSEIKPTKGGTGARLAIDVTIQEPEKWRGRKVFTGFNIKNDNPVAQDIAFKQLSALAHAVGVLQVEDSQQLHGIPLKVRIKETPASGEYEAGNDITAYRNMAEEVKLGPAKEQAATTSAPGGMQQPVGFNQGGMQQPAGFAQQQPQAQMQQTQQFNQQQPAQQQPQQFQQQQPVQQAPVQQMQQPQGGQQQPWQQPQAQQPWANDPSQQGQQAQQPQQQMQQPVQQQMQQPVQQQQFVDPSQQQMQQQQPVQQMQQQAQQPVQQQQMAQDPAQIAQQATPPWMTQGQQAQ